MNTRNLQKMLAVMAIAGLALSASTALAQNSTTVAQPAAINASVPQLSYGVAQIVQLAQAKVSEDTIIAYVKNSGNSYGLTVDQIIYLRQQGISDAVITTMLNQPKPAVATVAAPTTPAPQPEASSTAATESGSTITTASGSTATVVPTVTYVQTAPATTYYSQPYYYPYVWYPPVAFSFGWGWGGGWHGGGGRGGRHR